MQEAIALSVTSRDSRREAYLIMISRTTLGPLKRLKMWLSVCIINCYRPISSSYPKNRKGPRRSGQSTISCTTSATSISLCVSDSRQSQRMPFQIFSTICLVTSAKRVGKRL